MTFPNLQLMPVYVYTVMYQKTTNALLRTVDLKLSILDSSTDLNLMFKMLKIKTKGGENEY